MPDMERQLIPANTEWAPKAGYSRAVRVGREVHVAGTTATDEEGNIVGGDDPYRQTVKALKNVQQALNEAGAEIDDVVRTRLYVTDSDDWKPISKAHGELFGDIRPASTLVEVSRLISPEILVEIEADAVITN